MAGKPKKDLVGAVRRRLRSRSPQFVRQRLYDWNLNRRRQWRAAPGVTRIERTPDAALTFDDGPDPVWTPAILDALAEQGATATFFLVGSLVEQHPEVARRIVTAGHEVALHGMEHHRHDTLGAAELRGELTACAATIAGACGISATRYRPPFGSMSPEGAAICRELGLELTYWSCWGQDWDPIGADRIARLVRRDLEPGAIILLHDAAEFAPRPDPAATVASIPLIAADAATRNLKLTSIAGAHSGHGSSQPAARPGRTLFQLAI